VKRTIRSTGGLVAVALAMLVLAACSTDDVSKAQRETIDQADGICQTAQDQIGTTLGDDPVADTAALKVAAEQILAIQAPSENLTTWKIFSTSVNNLWLNMLDYTESLLPLVNDRARAAKALETAATNNKIIIESATDYKMEECSEGFAPRGTQLKS
jgi:hypothetical protein